MGYGVCMTTVDTIKQWAKDHRVSEAALDDLRQRLGADSNADVDHSERGRSRREGAVQAEVRLSVAADRDRILWRNNSGAAIIEGREVRWGLMNESKRLNTKCKSPDLVGIRRVMVTESMVGSTIGQFYARECKRRDWVYHAKPREKAQYHAIMLINSYGGDAAFTTGDE